MCEIGGTLTVDNLSDSIHNIHVRNSIMNQGKIVHNTNNMRPFTTIGSTREKPLVEIENRPKTAQTKAEMKLPKLKPKNGTKVSLGHREPMLNNFVDIRSQNNIGYHSEDGSKSNVSSPRSIVSRSASKWKLLKRNQSFRKGSATSVDTGLGNSMNGDISRPVSAWDAFENHIKQVNDSALTMEFDEQSLDFKCSDAFKRIMHELGPKKVKKVTKRSESLSSHNIDVFDEADEADESEGDGEEDEEGEDDYVLGETDYERRRRRRALRAWGLVRRHIQEIRMERRRAAGSINWDFLRQTISALSDMEKARQDLYEKYIYKPNSWAHGLTKCPEHLTRKYQNSGPLLPPVSESNPTRSAKNTRHSVPSHSPRHTQGPRKRSGSHSCRQPHMS